MLKSGDIERLFSDLEGLFQSVSVEFISVTGNTSYPFWPLNLELMS